MILLMMMIVIYPFNLSWFDIFPFIYVYNKKIFVLIKHLSSQLLSQPVRSNARTGERTSTAESKCDKETVVITTRLRGQGKGLKLDEADKKTDAYTKRLLGGISIYERIPGSIAYNELENILAKLASNHRMLCIGHVTLRFLEELLPYAEIQDIQRSTAFKYPKTLPRLDCWVEEHASRVGAAPRSGYASLHRRCGSKRNFHHGNSSCRSQPSRTLGKI